MCPDRGGTSAASPPRRAAAPGTRLGAVTYQPPHQQHTSRTSSVQDAAAPAASHPPNRSLTAPACLSVRLSDGGKPAAFPTGFALRGRSPSLRSGDCS